MIERRKKRNFAKNGWDYCSVVVDSKFNNMLFIFLRRKNVVDFFAVHKIKILENTSVIFCKFGNCTFAEYHNFKISWCRNSPRLSRQHWQYTIQEGTVSLFSTSIFSNVQWACIITIQVLYWTRQLLLTTDKGTSGLNLFVFRCSNTNHLFLVSAVFLWDNFPGRRTGKVSHCDRIKA